MAAEAALLHATHVRRAPLRPTRALAAVDVADPLVAEADEMLEHEFGPMRLVDHDEVGIDAAGLAPHDNSRGLRRRGGDVGDAHARADEDDPVDPILEQRLTAPRARGAPAGRRRRAAAGIQLEASSSTPPAISAKNGLRRSSSTTPTVFVRRLARLRAIAFGR